MEEEGAPMTANSSQADHQAQNLVREIRTQTRLHWNYLHLQSLPPELTEEGSHIEQIHLKCNALTRLPDNFGRLMQLTCCYLNSNELESLPDSIGDLKALRVLDLGNNNLRALPPSLGMLPYLRSLVVVHNKLTSFPPELCNLKSLSILMLSGNQLTSLPSAMDGMRGLMGLYLDHNRLRELPRSLTELPVLARISCCCNWITHLPALPFIARPKIYYDNNAVNYLPFAMVRQLKAGPSWDPVILPTCSYVPKVVMENNTVHIGISTQTHASALVLPSQIRGVSIHVSGRYTVPPLKELCLSLIYGAKAWPSEQFVSRRDCKSYSPYKESSVLPKVLLGALEEGPIAWCDYLECQRSIFTYATILVVPMSATPKEGLEAIEIPMLLYFCSDHCAIQLRKYCETMCGSLFIWLAAKMKNCLNIEIV